MTKSSHSQEYKINDGAVIKKAEVLVLEPWESEHSACPVNMPAFDDQHTDVPGTVYLIDSMLGPYWCFEWTIL